MKNSQNMTIVLLTITAVLLSVMLYQSYSDRTAYAEPSVKQGDYVMGTGAWSASTDLLYVIDVASRQLNVYFANQNTSSLDLINSVDLEKAFRQ